MGPARPVLSSTWSRRSRGFQKRRSKPEPRTSVEFMSPIETEIVVIGAGPGGYAAAFYAADKGKKVILIERETRLGGVCLNRGCIPSKAYLHAAKLISEARDSSVRGIDFAPPTINLEK